jgi:hypothetical protein
VLSKVDGYSAVTDFSLTLGASATTTPGTGKVYSALTVAELNSIGFTGSGTPYTDTNGNARWNSEFGTDG